MTPDAGQPVALVTGSRKGIGRFLAEHLLARGYLVEGCSRKPAGWSAPGYTHHAADVGDEAQVHEMFRAIAHRHARLDALINNAAVATMNLAMLTPLETVEKILRTNVAGAFLASREAAKLMRKRKYGRIVSITSAVVPLRLAGEAIYVASKSAVEALSQVLAQEVAGIGVTVNVVGPGPTETDMIRGVPREKIEKTLGAFSIPRLTTMEDIANAVDFFLRPESAAVTGQVLYLNGPYAR
jgi:3-oxoacyl-[acyl-carrier protein] reductase